MRFSDRQLNIQASTGMLLEHSNSKPLKLKTLSIMIRALVNTKPCIALVFAASKPNLQDAHIKDQYQCRRFSWMSSIPLLRAKPMIPSCVEPTQLVHAFSIRRLCQNPKLMSLFRSTRLNQLHSLGFSDQALNVQPSTGIMLLENSSSNP